MSGIFHVRSVFVGLNCQMWPIFNTSGYLDIRKISGQSLSIYKLSSWPSYAFWPQKTGRQDGPNHDSCDPANSHGPNHTCIFILRYLHREFLRSSEVQSRCLDSLLATYASLAASLLIYSFVHRLIQCCHSLAPANQVWALSPSVATLL